MRNFVQITRNSLVIFKKLWSRFEILNKLRNSLRASPASCMTVARGLQLARAIFKVAISSCKRLFIYHEDFLSKHSLNLQCKISHCLRKERRGLDEAFIPAKTCFISCYSNFQGRIQELAMKRCMKSFKSLAVSTVNIWK